MEIDIIAESLDNKFLLFGEAGYTGSHTCKALARAGYLHVVYDR